MITEPALDLQLSDMTRALRNLVTDVEQGVVLIEYLDVRTILDGQHYGIASLEMTMKACRMGRPTEPTREMVDGDL